MSVRASPPNTALAKAAVAARPEGSPAGVAGPDLRRYESHRGFYDAVYPQTIVSRRRLSDDCGLTLCRQSEGDWSDAPTPDLVFSFVTRGSGGAAVDLGAGRFDTAFRAGDLLIVPPGAGSSIRRDADHAVIGLEVAYAPFRSRLGGADALPPGGDFGAAHGRAIRDPTVSGLIRSLWGSAKQAPADALFVDGILMALMARVLHRATPRPGPARVASRLSPWQERRARAILEAEPGRAIALDRLAGEVGLSPFHFARAFKASVGVSPHRYQIRSRIAHAQTLLATTDLSVGAIAAASGYDDSSYFARLFAREAGTTPARYRRERRR